MCVCVCLPTATTSARRVRAGGSRTWRDAVKLKVGSVRASELMAERAKTFSASRGYESVGRSRVSASYTAIILVVAWVRG